MLDPFLSAKQPLLFVIFFLSLLLKAEDTSYVPDLDIYKGKEDSVYNLVFEYQYKDPDTCILFANIYLALAQQGSDSTTLSYAWMLKADAHYFKSDFSTSELYYKKALQFVEHKDDPFKDKPYLYYCLGEVYSQYGEYYKAIDYFTKALNLNQKYGFNDDVFYVEQAIANIHLFQYNFDLAKTIIDKGLAYAENNKNQDIKLSAQLGLLDYYYESKQYDKLLPLGKKLLNKAYKLEDKLNLAFTHSDLSIGYAFINNKDSALYHAEKAISFGHQYGEPMTISYMQMGYAETYLLLNQPERAIDWAEKSYHSAKKLNSRPIIRASLKVLFEAYEGIGNNTQALYTFKEFKAYDDTLLQMNINAKIVESENLLTELENKRLKELNELQKKNIQNKRLLLFSFIISTCILLIVLLLLNNSKKRKNKYTDILVEKSNELRNKQFEIDTQTQELLKKNIQLEKVNKTKDKLFSVLSHDIREPFIQLRGLIGLIKDAVLTPEKLEQLATKLERQSEKVNQSVDNLLIWSKTQLQGFTVNKETIFALREVTFLIEESKETLEGKNQKVELHIPENFTLVADRDQFTISLRNLLLNASNYSTQDSTIEINAFEQEDYKVIEVRDEGIGISLEKLEMLRNFNTENHEKLLLERSTGLGILIIHEFQKHIGGKLEIDSVRGKGSQFRLLYPKNI